MDQALLLIEQSRLNDLTVMMNNEISSNINNQEILRGSQAIATYTAFDPIHGNMLSAFNAYND